MNPGLVVKLRPTGPWRIGSDSGARNRVDAIYHSDSLYAAVASAMARLGMLQDWLDATARAASPTVSGRDRFHRAAPYGLAAHAPWRFAACEMEERAVRAGEPAATDSCGPQAG
jgi:hypothetical protein